MSTDPKRFAQTPTQAVVVIASVPVRMSVQVRNAPVKLGDK